MVKKIKWVFVNVKLYILFFKFYFLRYNIDMNDRMFYD